MAERAMKIAMLGALVAISITPVAQAQKVIHWPSPARSAEAPISRYYLPLGWPVKLRTLAHVSTKLNKAGDRISLEVAEDVSFQGQVIIPVGAPVVAEVASVERNGHFGKKGRIAIRLIEVQTPHGPLRLTGIASREGKNQTALSVGTIAFVSVLGFLIHGTSATIPSSTVVEAQTARDLAFDFYSGNKSADSRSARLANSNF